jgi:hypothetical protein
MADCFLNLLKWDLGGPPPDPEWCPIEAEWNSIKAQAVLEEREASSGTLPQEDWAGKQGLRAGAIFILQHLSLGI